MQKSIKTTIVVASLASILFGTLLVPSTMAKEGKLDATKYENVFWRSIDSHKDIEEAAREISGVPVYSKR
jgi:hypothetical protein